MKFKLCDYYCIVSLKREMLGKEIINIDKKKCRFSVLEDVLCLPCVFDYFEAFNNLAFKKKEKLQHLWTGNFMSLLVCSVVEYRHFVFKMLTV